MNYNLTKSQAPTILVVEDDESTGEVLTLAISQETPYCPLLVRSGHDALHVFQKHKLNLLILDYLLPDITGIDLYDRIYAINESKAIPTILMSATNPSEEIAPRDILLIEKPFELDRLLEAINSLMDQECPSI
ncbi:MAG TPA: response regulator [Ktedonobacteraceae bacterium]|jgi:DNA-binding response OmpR family regulator